MKLKSSDLFRLIVLACVSPVLAHAADCTFETSLANTARKGVAMVRSDEKVFVSATVKMTLTYGKGHEGCRLEGVDVTATLIDKATGDYVTTVKVELPIIRELFDEGESKDVPLRFAAELDGESAKGRKFDLDDLTIWTRDGASPRGY